MGKAYSLFNEIKVILFFIQASATTLCCFNVFSWNDWYFINKHNSCIAIKQVHRNTGVLQQEKLNFKDTNLIILDICLILFSYTFSHCSWLNQLKVTSNMRLIIFPLYGEIMAFNNECASVLPSSTPHYYSLWIILAVKAASHFGSGCFLVLIPILNYLLLNNFQSLFFQRQRRCSAM